MSVLKNLNSKNRKTLELIFEEPVRADVEWKNIERLFIALGAEVTKGNGSRVRVALNNRKAIFHRPHPQKETDKGALKSVRRFLMGAGVSV